MLFLLCLLALALSFVLTPAVIGLAWRIGAVDVPCDGRRMHHQSIPRAGGIAVYTAFLAVAMVGGDLRRDMICILCGGGLMLAVGLADDIFCLDAWAKFFFQIAATTATVIGCGIETRGGTLGAILWVLALTNAHNFIDGLDGLFSGCAAIEGVALFLVLSIEGNGTLAVLALLLALSCLGFRYFNRYPAQIFAGDCGSATVGFLLGVLSLPLFETPLFDAAVLSPFLIFAYPLTDLTTAVFRRVLRGKSPFLADRGHFHHRLFDAGLLHPQCTGVLTLIGAGFAVVGILVRIEALCVAAAISCVALAFLLMRIRRFVEEFH